ncbi:MAG TPA: type II toxin-antitoxin system HicA family toxin [Candidatus Nanoarchaeia archaeon]|nr:type II toxin-antitoxin system HicA family toxin [Candidatus Nanoarchaeia archaeon]
MSRLPRLNGNELAKIAEKLGFKFLRQVGSHMMYEHSDGRKKAMKNRFA